MASVFVLVLRSLISSGVTGSSPYSSLKGVNFVAMQMEVLWLHIFLMAVNINVFAFSTATLD
jgi:hypothetical protein